MNDEKPPDQEDTLYPDSPVVPAIGDKNSRVKRFLGSLLPVYPGYNSLHFRCLVALGIIGEEA